MKRRIGFAATLAIVAAVGVFTALALAPPASAWDWMNLPTGYRVVEAVDGTCPGDSSHSRYWIKVNGFQIIPSTCDPAGFQAALDAYIDSTICTVNPTAGGSQCVTTTAAPATVTGPVVPPTTTTTETATAPLPTTATTTPDPPPPPPPADTTTTVAATTTTTTVLTPTEQSFADQIAELRVQLATLTDRVSRLEKAVDAAWLAYEDALNSGHDAAAAADIARATYLNAVYGLGVFSP